MAVINTWNLITANGIHYVVGITDTGDTFLQVEGKDPLPIDPVALGGVLAQVDAALTQLGQTVCPVQLSVDGDTFTCDSVVNHERTFHHDPRAFYWYGP
jgi:hypothetical protein